MRIWFMTAFCLGLAATVLPAIAQEGAPPSPRELNETAVPMVMAKAVDDFIRPGYRDLVTAAAKLAKTTSAYCAAPAIDGQMAVQTDYKALVQHWSTIEIVRTGPVTEGNRFERFLFFPDRKGTGLKQVQHILADADESAADPVSLNAKSVAAQGLGALDYVLYGAGAKEDLEKPGSFRCRYAAAIARNLENIAGELSAEWEKPDGIQADWKTPGPGNRQFRDNKEAVTELLGVFVHGVESIRDQRLRPFYAGDPAKANPKLAIYWRSGQTMASLAANYAAYKRLFDVSDMQALLPEDSRSIAGSIDYILTALVRNAGRIDRPLPEVIADETQRYRLDFLRSSTDELLQRLNKDFGGAIGLGAGFSFADGD